MDLNDFLGELNRFNSTLRDDKKFTIIDGSQFDNPELDENGVPINIKDQDGNIIGGI
tara:strand:- start:395 stop:565 length:171 start_codon:yes stop_codon:yes gene_type:complete